MIPSPFRNKLFQRATRKAGVLWRRAAKRLRQSVMHRDVQPGPLFVVGCQRSGTNMLMDVLEKSPDTWTYNEDHGHAFTNYRIKPWEERMRLIRKARCRWVVFKPLCDSQNIDRLLASHPDATAIWEFRRYQDVANSALHNWGLEHQRWMIRMAATEPGWDHWLVDRMPPDRRQLLQELYDEGMSFHTAASLKWYLRNAIYFDYGLNECPDRVRLLGYEESVQHPVEQFSAVFDFLGVEFRRDYISEVFTASIRKQNFPSIDPRVETLCEDMTERLQQALQEVVL